MKLHFVFIVALVLVTNRASCGVIEGVYDKVSNTTQEVKDDIEGWWSYGVDSMKESLNTNQTECEESIIGKLYDKVKGGVTSGYMKVHDFVLGKDSDPNKGIIRTFYERAKKRLTDITSYIFGDDEKPVGHENKEDVKKEVLKLLFSNRTDIFNTEHEQSALNSLRNKLTRSGEGAVELVDSEKDLIRRAYESVRRKSEDVLRNVGVTAINVKNEVQDNIEKTQEFIHDAVSPTTQKIDQEVKQTNN